MQADSSTPFKKDILFYSDGSAKEFLTWMDNLESLIAGQTITATTNKHTMARHLLKGNTLSEFNHLAASIGVKNNANYEETCQELKSAMFPK